MTDTDDTDLDALFIAETEQSPSAAAQHNPPWKVMIVDDEPAIHEVTRLALHGVTFDKRPLEFISCFSAIEARAAIVAHPDTAVILLDVVMETEHAGLDFAQFVRETAQNKLVRIVLRTGQPGQAPERKVIVSYDINDYKEKTELTSSKLFTLMYASLRAYRDIITIENNKRALAKIIDSSADIFKLSSLERFAEGVLEQIGSLVSSRPGTLFLKADGVTRPDGLAACFEDGTWRKVAGTGRYEDSIDPNPLLGGPYKSLLDHAITTNGIAFDDDALLAHFTDQAGGRNLLLLDGISRMGENEIGLIEIYMRNVSTALENIALHDDLEHTQREIIYLLGEAVETRSKETGGHVRRVAELSHFLALACGLPESDAGLLKAASPLHDLGKIAIPDAILHKPGRLTPEERDIIRTHAEIGYNLLKPSHRDMLQAGAAIAHEHHERWDGQGYPHGKKGEEINLFARITSVADVFDSLLHKRSYKAPWSLEETLAYFRQEAGAQFDPHIVQVLLDNVEAVCAILARFPESEALDGAGPQGSSPTPFLLQH